MAIKGSGIAKQTIDPPMENRESTTPINPRMGAPKRVQAGSPIHPGMKSRIDYQGAAPRHPGTGPEASSPDVMDPEPETKKFAKPEAAWGMLDPNKQSVNHELGQKVLDEAQLAVQYSGDKSRAANAAR